MKHLTALLAFAAALATAAPARTDPSCVKTYGSSESSEVWIPAPRPPTQQEWKNAIIAEAEKYCGVYPTDPICHFTDRPPDAPPR